MELSRQMLLLTAVNYGSYYLHITKQHYILAIDITFAKTPAAVTDAPAP